MEACCHTLTLMNSIGLVLLSATDCRATICAQAAEKAANGCKGETTAFVHVLALCTRSSAKLERPDASSDRVRSKASWLTQDLPQEQNAAQGSKWCS